MSESTERKIDALVSRLRRLAKGTDNTKTEEFDRGMTQGYYNSIALLHTALLLDARAESEELRELLWNISMADHMGDVLDALKPLIEKMGLSLVANSLPALEEAMRERRMQPQWAKEDTLPDDAFDDAKFEGQLTIPDSLNDEKED